MNLALFDFDGTITTGDTWTPFMRRAVRPARILVGQVPLLPAIVGYRVGIVSASECRKLAVKVGFRGESAARVRERGAEYAANVLPAIVRPQALEQIEWHRSRGDEVVVVSASLDVYLQPWCESRGLACICTMLEEDRGTLTGRYVFGDCCDGEKVRRIRACYDLTQYAYVYAYGDSGEDRAMLELAHKKYYRWKEISSWQDVTGVQHPPAVVPSGRQD